MSSWVNDGDKRKHRRRKKLSWGGGNVVNVRTGMGARIARGRASETQVVGPSRWARRQQIARTITTGVEQLCIPVAGDQAARRVRIGHGVGSVLATEMRMLTLAA